MKRLLKNKFVAASLLFLAIDLIGSFAVLAPFLVMMRNKLDKSALALKLWPIISFDVVADIFLNEPYILAMGVVSAIVIFLIFTLLLTFFSGGIYNIIITDGGVGQFEHSFAGFLMNSARFWPGFLKTAILSIPIYLIAAFLGFSFGRLAAGIAFMFGVFVFLLFMLIASTYIQLLRVEMITSGSNSVVGAVRSSRSLISRSLLRILAGNISVSVAGFLIAFLLWMALRGIRSLNWSSLAAAISIVLQQLIVLAICLMQTLRINFNYTILKRGEENALGGTQLDRI